MPDWSLLGGGARYEASALGTGSYGVDVTSSSTVNTKGSYVDLIASVSVEVTGLELSFRQTVDANSYLIDIAVGAATAEQDIISNILTGGKTIARTEKMQVPLHIPRGSRISARIQSSGQSSILDLAIVVWGQSFPPPSPLGRITTYGDTTADSGGISIDAGASTNTKGAYSEISASVGNNIKMIWMALGGQDNVARPNSFFAFDIAVGAGTSEQVVVSDIVARVASSTDTVSGNVLGPYPVNIPSGSRLAVRSQSSTADATDRLLDVVLYGGE